MAQSNKVSPRIFTFTIVAVAFLAAVETARSEKADPKDNACPQWFVRPTQPKGTPSEVLDDLGVKVMAFEYRAPKAHRVVLTFGARDENGKVITELAQHSRTIAFRNS